MVLDKWPRCPIDRSRQLCMRCCIRPGSRTLPNCPGNSSEDTDSCGKKSVSNRLKNRLVKGGGGIGLIEFPYPDSSRSFERSARFPRPRCTRGKAGKLRSRKCRLQSLKTKELRNRNLL